MINEQMSAIISDAKAELAYRAFSNSNDAIGLYVGSIKGSSVLITDQHDLDGDISRDNVAIINPSIQPPGATTLTLSSQIQFRIEAKSCGQIDEVWLDLTMGESSGTGTVTPVLAPFLFNNIVVGVSSSASLQTLYPEHLYTRFQQETNEQCINELAGNAQNMSFPSFTGPSAIAPGGTATYSFRFPMFMMRKELDMRASRQPILVTFYFNPNPVVSSTGAGALQYVTSQLRIRYRRDDYYDPIRLRALDARPLILSYMQTPITQFTQTLTAGVRQVIPLTSVTGYMASLLVIVRTAATYTTPTAGGIYNFLAIDGPAPSQGTSSGYMDLLAADSSSYFASPNILTPYYFRTQAMLEPRSKGIMGSNVAFYRMDFCTDFTKVIETGVCSGGILFDGNQQLIISPATSFAQSGSSCVITVVPYLYATMVVNKGEFRFVGSGASL